MEKTEKEVNK